MLNRRILRIKAFKALYAYAENPDLSLKQVLGSLEASVEATRDLYLYMMALIPALTQEAAKRVEAARGKFNPSEEERNPNLKFVENRMAALLSEDPDFQRLLEKKKFSWEQNDAFLNGLWETLKSRDYFRSYMASPEHSLAEDAVLWKTVYRQELEDDAALAAILEDASIFWADELGYVLGACLNSLEEISRHGRWNYPPLYQSEQMESRGKTDVASDGDFVRKLVSAAYGRFNEYQALIAGLVSKWDRDRLVAADTVLIGLGLAEAETFPDIPVRVTINEYVEISKYYSTPRSHGFVNGLLDRLIREREAEGKITKTV